MAVIVVVQILWPHLSLAQIILHQPSKTGEVLQIPTALSISAKQTSSVPRANFCDIPLIISAKDRPFRIWPIQSDLDLEKEPGPTFHRP